MTPPLRVVFETTAELSLESCENFLLDQLQLPLSHAEKISRDLVTTSLERLTTHPHTYPVCRLALELGIGHYRELLIDGYRVIYRFWSEQEQGSVYLFAHQRQDFKQLLFEYQLLS
ncbi:type II toxin-antitoxin system RelE/ParE family toxin [Billgrantia kenyensis]|uniref:Type II toxin-antitoxin system RelE/ParE family toxin n=1 Tax=Billgrantia kenyensis TaxID=321266 RepID=A0A7W0ADA8_9GAMM|nr:type II toxin-antitoxin system RelE/ParE family toxin [Halomonas kenyensis]MBA2778419.1 type II toxin-antitoxin system RelE/ParE family toxin [Halomonas kenyensis]MCG6660725.1 type II toxin-antitoxin system RelE/ParE family toxin [Halomonas kenyensis]